MTGYQRAISRMSADDLDNIQPIWWGMTYAVASGVIVEAVEGRRRELAEIEALRAREEATDE